MAICFWCLILWLASGLLGSVISMSAYYSSFRGIKSTDLLIAGMISIGGLFSLVGALLLRKDSTVVKWD